MIVATQAVLFGHTPQLKGIIQATILFGAFFIIMELETFEKASNNLDSIKYLKMYLSRLDGAKLVLFDLNDSKMEFVEDFFDKESVQAIMKTYKVKLEAALKDLVYQFNQL